MLFAHHLRLAIKTDNTAKTRSMPLSSIALLVFPLKWKDWEEGNSPYGGRYYYRLVFYFSNKNYYFNFVVILTIFCYYGYSLKTIL